MYDRKPLFDFLFCNLRVFNYTYWIDLIGSKYYITQNLAFQVNKYY